MIVMPLFFLPLLLLAAEIVPARPGVVYEQPQIASGGRDVGVVFGAKNTIYYANFGNSPIVVGEAPSLSLGNHRGPRIAFATNAIVIAAGIGHADQQYGPNTLRTWRSTDHGKTWAPGPAASAPGAGRMGFQALASDGDKRLVAAWIGPANGAPRLFAAHSDDAGLTWSAQSVLSQTVCECCHPSITVSGDGVVRILFRNSLKGNRDFNLATALDGEHFEIVKLGRGNWPLNECPMDVGGIAEFQGSVVTLWRRESDLFLARPDGLPEERLATGKNPSVTLRGNGVYAVWSTSDGIMAKLPGKSPYLLSHAGAFPVLTARGRVIAAWEEKGVIHMEPLEP
jgi:hypothetical protein